MFKRCSCINPSTGKQYGRRCPKLERSDHGTWWFTHDVPPGADGRRRRPTRGPFASEHEADIALTESLAAWNAGIRVETPASLTVGQYLDDWLAGKVNLEPKTRQGYESHLRLYLKPGLGHLRLTDLRDHHVEQLYAAMRQVGRDRHAKPSPILARILEVRHDDPARRRPPSAANLRRVHATLMSALNSAVKRRKIPYNPAEHVELEIPRRPKPRAWTAARVAAWERTGRRPSKVMVWTPDQAGAFLDFATADRLYPLWHLVAQLLPQLYVSIMRCRVDIGPGLEGDASIRVFTAPAAIIEAEPRRDGAIRPRRPDCPCLAWRVAGRDSRHPRVRLLSPCEREVVALYAQGWASESGRRAHARVASTVRRLHRRVIRRLRAAFNGSDHPGAR